MGQFFEDCHKAGPSRCPFCSENGPASTEGNLIATLQLLNKTPLPVAGSDSHGPDVITYSDIMKVFKLTLYDPMKLFPQLADLLTSVSNSGSGADFAHSNRRSRVPYARTNHPKIPPHPRISSVFGDSLDTVHVQWLHRRRRCVCGIHGRNPHLLQYSSSTEQVEAKYGLHLLFHAGLGNETFVEIRWYLNSSFLLLSSRIL
jgi:hypothetical protein